MAKSKKPTMSYEAGLLRAMSPAGFPILTKALLSLTPVECREVPIAAVDEWWRLYYNPDFFATLSISAATGVIIHEVWHLLRFHFLRARRHGVRREERFLWNLAADVEIHDDYRKLLSLLGEMPPGFEPLQRTSFNPPLKQFGTAETWFDELKSRATFITITIDMDILDDGEVEGESADSAGKERVLFPREINNKDPSSKSIKNTYDGSGANGHTNSWEKPGPLQGGPQGMSPERAGMVRDFVARAIQHASATIGTGDGGIVRWANEIINPQVDWRVKLRNVFQGAMARVIGDSHHSYRTMNRRYNNDPRIIKPGSVNIIPRVGVIVDTSGSMSDTMLSVCRQEITSLLDSMGRNLYVHVYACDARAHVAQKVRTGADVKLYGGGGTDMVEAFKLIQKDVQRGLSFDLLILMTDGYTPWPTADQLPCQTLLMLVGSRSQKFPSYPDFFEASGNNVVKAYVD